ncbi:hypothetical protein GALMADRAFT_139179 [Galerina marginata CBS 339.88]|uniref:Uncharacterized protein n=1 Tax=Galerina marginata (strain CBS 339.88) TaxID=685588 RepID=A0A067TB85_GALM3|nr:hypothetical protein GALMADRAFT_139179 [Galerina marginata CBS 339.88]
MERKQQLLRPHSMPHLLSNLRASASFIQTLKSNDQIFPPEILALVFEMVLEHYTLEYGEHNFEIRLREAATIRHASQVCHYWRNVALSCTRIWGKLINIDSSGFTWTQELLTRSRTAPLIIQSSSDLDRFNQVPGMRFSSIRWQAIFAEAARIKVLHTSFSSRDDIHFLTNLVLEPAPLLESCNFVLDLDDDTVEPVGYQSIFRGDPFNGHAPNLRCLTSHAAFLPSFRLADFTHLNLRHLDIAFPETSIPMSLSRWLDILASQPLLEFLTLTNFTVERYNATSPLNVNLPRLNTLYLLAEINDCDRLFGHLVLPPTAFVHINLEQNTGEISVHGLSRGLERIFRSWDEHSDSSCYQWRLETDEYEGFNIGIGPADPKANFFLSQLTIEYTTDAPYTDWVPHPFSNFLRLLQNAPLVNREAVLFLGLEFSENSSRVVSVHTLRPFLSAFKNVSKLILCGERFDQRLLWTLVSTPIPLPAKGTPALLFPNLSSIGFVISWDYPLSLDRFHGFLHWRYTGGRQVPNVILIADDPEYCNENESIYFAKTVQVLANVDVAPPAPPYCSLCGTC